MIGWTQLRLRESKLSQVMTRLEDENCDLMYSVYLEALDKVKGQARYSSALPRSQEGYILESFYVRADQHC